MCIDTNAGTKMPSEVDVLISHEDRSTPMHVVFHLFSNLYNAILVHFGIHFQLHEFSFLLMCV